MFEQPRGRPFKPGQSGNPALIQIRVQIGIPLALFDTTLADRSFRRGEALEISE